jgi:hypothetical protein
VPPARLPLAQACSPNAAEIAKVKIAASGPKEGGTSRLVVPPRHGMRRLPSTFGCCA